MSRYRMTPVKKPPPVYWEFRIRDCATGETFGPYKTRDQAEAHMAEFEEEDAAFSSEGRP